MKIIIFAIIFTSVQLYCQTKFVQLDSITISKSEEGHSFSLKLLRQPFDKQKHEISRIDKNIIDNVSVFGIDGSMPISEFSLFELQIDNKVVSISPKAYQCFFNPNFGYKSGPKYVEAYFGNDFNSVFVYMNGSDGAGSYSVTWHIEKSGKYSYSIIPIYDMYFKMNDE